MIKPTSEIYLNILKIMPTVLEMSKLLIFERHNNQNKGSTRRMITRLNLMFSRRSPYGIVKRHTQSDAPKNRFINARSITDDPNQNADLFVFARSMSGVRPKRNTKAPKCLAEPPNSGPVYPNVVSRPGS